MKAMKQFGYHKQAHTAGPCQTSETKLLVKIFIDLKLFKYFRTKTSVLDA